ncbi:anticodon-binding protein [Pelagophyceae sp. CCMP2097]|nr:anticodon-binding protein [Pelagophyceae sp. CCMP2097]
MGKSSAEIGNKFKRVAVFHAEKAKKSELRQSKRQRQKDLARDGEIGDDVPVKKQRTIENTREVEVTAVPRGDREILQDERDDEFAMHEGGAGTAPKIMLTTRPRPSKELFDFCGDLMDMFPNMFFYPRRTFSVKQICAFASNKAFTHVVVLSEKLKKCNAMLLVHLPIGPTAFFKLSNVETAASIGGAGRKTDHQPEVLLNNFGTRLGRRVGRALGSLFQQAPQFQGRQAVTFHNQRDYIFVRRHRYIFEESAKPTPATDAGARAGAAKDKKAAPTKRVIARLQELGPRFTLKLRWLQEGTYDVNQGEYEWFHRRKQMDTSRRKFHL